MPRSSHPWTSLTSFFLLILVTAEASAHTISRHVVEMYGELHTPLIVLSKLLPFLGLGMISGEIKLRRSVFFSELTFVLALFFGLSIAIVNDEISILQVANNFWILILGICLIFTSSLPDKFKLLILIMAGFSLGYEFAVDFRIAKEHWWIPMLLLSAGMVFFIVLTQIQILRSNTKKILIPSTGIFFVLVGLIVILLT